MKTRLTSFSEKAVEGGGIEVVKTQAKVKMKNVIEISLTRVKLCG